MPKSKNNRKMKKNNNNLLKSAPSKSSYIINHSPNSTLLATLINNNDLNGLSFFIKELCNESQLIFGHNFKEWFDIFIESIKKDLSLAKYVAKNIYYSIACNSYIHSSVKASEILSEYIWNYCSDTYANECIFPSSDNLIDMQGRASSLETLLFLDSSIKYTQLISNISDCYQHSTLKSANNRQKIQSKLVNF
jgi:hypothetical protein